MPKATSKATKRTNQTPTRSTPKAKAKPRPAARKSAKPAHGSKGGMRTGSLDHLPRSKTGVVLLAGDNPRIAKADGDAPVQQYIAAIPGWRQDVARRIDALITRTVPGARKAVKWNSPFYGMPGQGWFVSLHVFAKAVKVTFFKGTSLRPVPPGGKSAEGRWIDVHEDDLDEAQMVAWLKQASSIPGWGQS